MSDAPETSAEALRAEGKLAEAAAAYRTRGALREAEALYTELWDFSAAAEVARERGDRPAELSHRLAANDLPGAAQVGEALERGSEPELRRGAEVYERHRRWLEAAGLRERLGELDAARDLFRRGQALLEVARIERGLGRTREAGLAYEQLLALEPEGPEAARAHLELGQLLFALDRLEEAARHLRAAANTSGPTKERALGDLALALDRIGYDLACDAVLDELRALAPATPSRVVFVVEHPAPTAGGPTKLAGRYQLEALLGASATGRAFIARDVITGRDVTARILLPTNEPRAKKARVAFFAELGRIRPLHHPNVVELLDLDEQRGLVVTERLPSGTLLDRLVPGRGLTPAAVRRLLLDVVDGLAAVHARGVVHRDLKPANLWYTATGQVRIGELGAAHLFSEEATQTAGFIGTLAYMAPEQISGAVVEAAADVYSLGAIAFHALTGGLPFPGPDFVAQHLHDAPPVPSAHVRSIDPAWDPLLLAMLAKDPHARPSSMDELHRRISRLTVGDDASGIGAAPIASSTSPTRPRYVAEHALASGAGGPIALGLDTRLGRQVVIETLAKGYVDSAAGQRHLRWLRDLARLGGPRLQRLFALAPRGDGGIDAIFEALPQRPLAGDRAMLRATLAPLHAAGIAHGAISTSLVEDAAGPAILVAGRAPRDGGSVDDDLASLT